MSAFRHSAYDVFQEASGARSQSRHARVLLRLTHYRRIVVGMVLRRADECRLTLEFEMVRFVMTWPPAQLHCVHEEADARRQ
jgi:hypothetical protein